MAPRVIRTSHQGAGLDVAEAKFVGSGFKFLELFRL